MNCRDMMNLVDEYLEGSLDAAEHERASAHVRGCRLCQQRVTRIEALRTALHALPVPQTPPPDLLERAMARAVEQSAQPAPRRRWPYAAGFALAASLALWIGAGWLPGTLDKPANEAAPVTIALHQPRVVQLSFNAEQDLRQATISIRLPAGVEVEGYPGQREIRWRTDLSRGVNMLSLPLRAVSPSGGTMTARLEYGERATELAVRLRVHPVERDGALRPGMCDRANDCGPSFMEVTDASV